MVRVSREGLSSCPGCRRFVKVEQVVAETVCPFCSHRFGEAAKAKASGKGRVLAAALLGSAMAVTACQVYGGPPGPIPEQPAQEQPAQEQRGDAGPTLPDAPVYGGPPAD